ALGAIDEARDVAGRHEEHTAERGERLTVIAMQGREQIEARERGAFVELTAELGEHHRVAAEQPEPEADGLALGGVARLRGRARRRAGLRPTCDGSPRSA